MAKENYKKALEVLCVAGVKLDRNITEIMKNGESSYKRGKQIAEAMNEFQIYNQMALRKLGISFEKISELYDHLD